MTLDRTRRGQGIHGECTLLVGRQIQPTHRTSLCRRLGRNSRPSPPVSVREVSAELEFDPDELEGRALRLVAKTGSLEIMDEVSQKDRRAIEGVISEVLNSQLYPEVMFRSSRAVCSRVDVSRYRAEVLGTANLHGEENEQAIQAQLILTEGSLRAHGEFRLRQSDFGLTIPSVAGGLLRIKDELKFVFFLVARKRNGA
jgi:polyisoprenoid-binding protein YceI